MEIIQQKLIWFMGNCAALILLYKLKLGRAGMREPTLSRLKAGVITLMSGCVVGIAFKTLLADAAFASSGFAFFIETVLGYTIGWALIIWGLVSWAKSYFDLRGRPLTTAGSRIISDTVMKSLLKGNGPKLMFNSLSKDIFSLLNCQALTVHKLLEDEKLHLVFHQGLTGSSVKLLEIPSGDKSVFLISAKLRQGVISDQKYTLHEFSYPETSKGPINSSISLPITYNGQLHGVLTAYRNKKKPFNADDLKVLEVAASGIGTSLQKENSDRELHQENRYKELLSIASKSLGTNEPMISALIKSAKMINNYLPLKWICLYVVGNGTSRSYDFNLPTGGVVKIVEGWLPKNSFPQLFNRDPNTGLKIVSGKNSNSNETTYIFPIGKATSPEGYIEFELRTSVSNSSYLPLLGNILTKRFSLYLQNDSFKGRIETFNSWLGALQYFYERATQTSDVSSLLQEIASSTADLTPVSFCRITLADSARRFLNSAALAQVRNLNWRNDFKSRISLSKAEFHKTALHMGAIVTFNQEDKSRRLPAEEAVEMIPSEVKCGAILPLTVGNKKVGLLTVGDCRKADRVFADSDPMYFLNSLAGTISMILTWHKEKRLSSEGKKKLTLMRKNMAKETVAKKPVPRINSRINGPLAGIMAACEYLKSGMYAEKDELDRYLGVIEKNASEIHQNISSP
jgi:GAF domain-containing protein